MIQQQFKLIIFLVWLFGNLVTSAVRGHNPFDQKDFWNILWPFYWIIELCKIIGKLV